MLAAPLLEKLLKVDKSEIIKQLRHDEYNLKSILEFYNEILAKNMYEYKLNNGFELKIRFYTENLPHLLGIHKVVPDKYYKSYIREKMVMMEL
ncbi:PBECR4 domain-containing protein [Inconstantimicrobium mannanitabidum]|uniref:PBECR4 domain-containing protein n=1 Tax=Inconstantimicrobium mannanitabidum TaxID=1604901 RepID=UPI0021C499D5|nr:PBECR4 domain-containing protein [Clostridium sp. TW13]